MSSNSLGRCFEPSPSHNRNGGYAVNTVYKSPNSNARQTQLKNDEKHKRLCLTSKTASSTSETPHEKLSTECQNAPASPVVLGSDLAVLGKNRDMPPYAPKSKSKKKVYRFRADIRQATAQRLIAQNYYATNENITGSSVLGCGRWKAHNQIPEAVMLVEGDHAEMDGHFRCKNNWTCECCACETTGRNRSWLRAGMMPSLEEHGKSASMMTLTLAHSRDDDWGDTVNALFNAFRAFDRRMAKLYAKIGYIGKLKALEPLVGKNGLHPHLHLLVSHNKSCTSEELAEFSEDARAAWTKAVTEAGGYCNSHGFDFREGAIAEYLAKRSVAHEMTSNNKNGRQGGLTLPQLLDRAGHGDVEAGADWLRAIKALAGKTRFHAGALPKNLGIPTPSEWEDLERQEETKATAANPEVVRIEYPLDDHVTATDNISGRPAMAMMKRAAINGGKVALLNMVRALCADVRKKRKAFYKKPTQGGKSLWQLGQETGDPLPSRLSGPDAFDKWLQRLEALPMPEPEPAQVIQWEEAEVPDWW